MCVYVCVVCMSLEEKEGRGVWGEGKERRKEKGREGRLRQRWLG